MNEIIRNHTSPTNALAVSVAALIMGSWPSSPPPVVWPDKAAPTRGTIERVSDHVVSARINLFEQEMAAVYATLLANQEPLGSEFETIWDANIDKLYES